MMSITTTALRAIMPGLSQARAERFVQPLSETFARFDISTPLRAAMFLAHAAVESGELYRLEEWMSYSAPRLRAVWPKRFPSNEVAYEYARQPAKLAEYVYGGRMGNGPEGSGDGWKYRGRGFGLTGRANYQAAGEALGLPLLEHPELVAEPLGACLTFGWFWDTHGLNRFADAKDLKNSTKIINGGLTGLPERQAYYAKALEVLG